MEGQARTPEGDQMRYMVFVIEAAARKMGISPSELVERLERQDLIDGRLTVSMMCCTRRAWNTWRMILLKPCKTMRRMSLSRNHNQLS